MKQTNLSIFVPHLGCPNTCSFCNQRFISGTQSAPTSDEVKLLLSQQQKVLEKNNTCAQIAFFGGSFTAIDEAYRNELLKTAAEFIEKYPEQFLGIRCSTRPDFINKKILASLKNYGVNAVELGAQSMSDEVLAANDRGHTAKDVEVASELIKEAGIELGLQMMTGLYMDSADACRYTGRKFVEIAPKTVRIYPTVILEKTKLAQLMNEKKYNSFSFDETVELCAELLELFESNGICVIRMGLHASDGVENAMLGGVYHPALREIVESKIAYKKMREQMKKGGHYVVFTDKKNISKIIGHGGCNKRTLLEEGISFKIKEEKATALRIEEI